MHKVDDIQSVNISAEERAKLMSTIEDLENEEALPAKADEEGSTGSTENPAEADPETAGETGPDDDAGGQVANKPVTIPKARFDEALSKERERTQKALEEAEELKARLKAVEDRLNAPLVAAGAPPMNFDEEKAKLRTRYDNGDIDAEEFEKERDKIVIAETAFLVKQEVATTQAAAATAELEADWNAKITAWTTQNAEFMSNPLRAQAVATLLEQYGADPNLSNADLLAKVEKDAFEAFSYKKPAAPTNPRDAADAAAASAAGALPGAITGGEGNRTTVGKANIENLKPGQFNKLSRAEQAELLGDEAAI